MVITTLPNSIRITGEPEDKKAEDLLSKSLGIREDMLHIKKKFLGFIVDSMNTREFLLTIGVPQHEIIYMPSQESPKDLKECRV